MANEYINRSRLLRHLADWWLTESPTGNEIPFINGEPQTTPAMKVIEECMKAVEEQPTADVVEVVRCKDCACFDRQRFSGKKGYCKRFRQGRIETNYCDFGYREEVE